MRLSARFSKRRRPARTGTKRVKPGPTRGKLVEFVHAAFCGKPDAMLITVASSEKEGFTHIEARCACGQIACLPFRLMRIERKVRDDTPIADIAERLRCEKCRRKPLTWRRWRQYMDGASIEIPTTYGKV